MSFFDRFKKKKGSPDRKTAPVFPPSQKAKAVTEASGAEKSATSSRVAASSKEKKEAAPKRLKVPRKQSGAYRVLLSPVVTEKAAHLQAQGQYAFEVHPRSTKNEVAKAVEDAYGVKPVAVNVVTIGSKARRYGRHEGFTRSRKKAMVTLRKGEHIELFETTS